MMVPVEELIANVENPNRLSSELSEDGKVVYKNNSIKPDYKQAQVAHLIILICF
jgi:hypothetical protein